MTKLWVTWYWPSVVEFLCRFLWISNDVRIVFNWYIGLIRFINIYWVDLVSFIIIVSMRNYCSWPLVRALWCWIGWFSIEPRFWGCCGSKIPYFLYFDIGNTSIILWLVWSTKGCGFMCFTCNWCGLVGATLCNMSIMALLETTWSNVTICVVLLCDSNIYMWSHICII